MALKPCRECGEKVSTEAKTCPNCGKKNPTVGKAVVRPHPSRAKKSALR